jgi:peptide-methionine (S)-S-oxide reductase
MERASASSSGSGRPSSEVITLGGGCFWCTEAVFSEIQGVISVDPGYAGGQAPHPSYEEVCTGRTGHAEVVQVTFDPAQRPLIDLLRVFFAVHDPTTRDRQGHDTGPQYRSIILYRTPEQKAAAEAAIREVEASRRWHAPVVTQVVPFEVFYPAEGYHRNYFQRNPDKAYCQMVVAPKVEKFRERFAAELRPPDRA